MTPERARELLAQFWASPEPLDRNTYYREIVPVQKPNELAINTCLRIAGIPWNPLSVCNTERPRELRKILAQGREPRKPRSPKHKENSMAPPDHRPTHEIENHLNAERRYLRLCRRDLHADPEYYQPQIDATEAIVDRLEAILEDRRIGYVI